MLMRSGIVWYLIVNNFALVPGVPLGVSVELCCAVATTCTYFPAGVLANRASCIHALYMVVDIQVHCGLHPFRTPMPAKFWMVGTE